MLITTKRTSHRTFHVIIDLLVKHVIIDLLVTLFVRVTTGFGQLVMLLHEHCYTHRKFKTEIPQI